MSDEPRPMTDEDGEAAIVEAKRDGGVCGITIELEAANGGQVIDGRCRVVRKVKARR